MNAPKSSRSFLRDEIDEPSDFGARVRALREEADAATELPMKSAVLGQLGDLLRLSDSHRDEAIEILLQAAELAERAQHPGLLAANRIRLAIALQYAGRHVEAVDLHQRAIDLIEQNRVRRLKDFAFQHLGKCYAEMGEASTARDCFRCALRIRRRRGDAELVASTEAALAELNRHDGSLTTGPR